MWFLTAPLQRLQRVFHEIHLHVEEAYTDREAIQHALAELHLRLEAGALTEEEFDSSEALLLERLTALEDALRQAREA